MNETVIAPFRGLFNALDIDAPNTQDASDLLNCWLLKGKAQPRWGYRSVAGPQSNFQGSYGFKRLIGYDTNNVGLEEWVSIENIDGTVKPFHVDHVTGSRTEITNAGTSQNLAASDWVGVQWASTSYWINPASAVSVFKHDCLNNSMWAQLNSLPNSAPPGTVGVSYFLPTTNTPAYPDHCQFVAGTDTVAITAQSGRDSSSTADLTTDSKGRVWIATADSGGGYGTGYVEFEVTLVSSNWNFASSMSMGFLINCPSLVGDTTLGTGNDGFQSDLTNWILTLTNAVPTTATLQGATVCSVVGKLNVPFGYAYVWFDLSGVASAVLSNIHKVRLRIPNYMTGATHIRVEGIYEGALRYHDKSNLLLGGNSNLFINDTGANTSTLEYAFNYTEAGNTSTAAAVTPIAASSHLGATFANGVGLPFGGSQLVLNVPVTSAAPYDSGATINLYRKIQLKVTGATNASPIVIQTDVAHALVDGQQIVIANVQGNTNANGTWYAKATSYDGTHFGLYQDQALTTPVSGNAGYTSGSGNVDGRWQKIATGSNAAPLIFHDTLRDSVIAADTTTYPVASALSFSAPAYVSLGVVNAFAYKGRMVWLYPGGQGNVRHSKVGDPETTRAPGDTSPVDTTDTTRPGTYTLSDDYSDQPVGGVQADQVAIILAKNGVYAQYGDTPSSMTPSRKVPGSIGCAGPFAFARFKSDLGDPGVVFVDYTGESLWFIGESSIYQGDTGSRPFELSAPIRGFIRKFLLDEQAAAFGYTDMSPVRVEVDEATSSVWVSMGARALVLRPLSPADGQRHWEAYSYAFTTPNGAGTLAGSTDPNTTGGTITTTNRAGATNDFTNPQYAAVEDSLNATAGPLPGGNKTYIMNVPDLAPAIGLSPLATLVSITIRVHRHLEPNQFLNAVVQDDLAQLTRNGSTVGSNLATSSAVPVGEGIISYTFPIGGTGITVADANAGNVGVQLGWTAVTQTPAPVNYNLSLNSISWQNPGITVLNGQSITVSASGVGTWDAPGHTAYPEGSWFDFSTTHTQVTTAPPLISISSWGALPPNHYWMAPSVRPFSLALAVEPANPGQNYGSALQPNRGPYSFNAPKDGTLWLGFNDTLPGGYSDNGGTFAVTITSSVSPVLNVNCVEIVYNYTIPTQGNFVGFNYLAFSPLRKLWMLSSSGSINELEWDSLNRQYIGGTFRDGGYSMPVGYWKSERLRGQRSRVFQIGLERDNLADAPVVTVVSDENVGGATVNFTSGVHYVKAPTSCTGRWHTLQFSIDETMSPISAIRMMTLDMPQTMAR
jgi:hypothetical protein